MKEFWNERYADGNYAYGEEPNLFLKQQIDAHKSAKILFPAEGEGRNAVYAASKGWEVTAFDQSIQGRAKALALAAKVGVDLTYTVASIEDFENPIGYFDAMALIFAHFPAQVRHEWHLRLTTTLRKGGVLWLQGFAKSQLGLTSGGPKDLSMLFSKEELIYDFKDILSDIHCEETRQVLDEGPFHQGEACLITLTGVKK